jgi:hypothetical protein
MDVLGIAVFLATINFAILSYIASPLKAKWPELDLWWFKWLALATGFVICWFAPLNILGDYVSNVILARILTALVVGCGAEIINVVFGASKAIAVYKGTAPITLESRAETKPWPLGW